MLATWATSLDSASVDLHAGGPGSCQVGVIQRLWATVAAVGAAECTIWVFVLSGGAMAETTKVESPCKIRGETKGH